VVGKVDAGGGVPVGEEGLVVDAGGGVPVGEEVVGFLVDAGGGVPVGGGDIRTRRIISLNESEFGTFPAASSG